MSSVRIESATVRNVVWGVLVGLVAGVVPIVSLFAPLLAGGVAGYLERAGPKRGVVVGALTGLVVAVAGLDFGAVGSVPLAGLLVGGAVWAIAAVGQVTLSALGGGLAALVEDDREAIAARFGPDAETGRRTRLVASLVGVSAALVTFVVVGLGVTAALDPYIWPSMVVGIPVGAVAGTAVGVLAFHTLTTRFGRSGGRTQGAS